MKPKIDCTKDGPYLVTGLKGLTDANGGPIATKEKFALCRCGGSANKPFCDGTHASNGFSDEKLPDRTPDAREDYQGETITIHDNRGICCHAGKCTDGLPAVWRMKTEPWIDPNGAEPEEIADTVRECPSGALSHSVDGVEHRDQDREPDVQVTEDGPYHVTGGVELPDVERGEGASEEHYALCRCGASKNKPFCDGTHWYIKFKDDGVRAGE